MTLKFDGTPERQPVSLEWKSNVSGFPVISDTKINFSVISNNKVLAPTGSTIPVTWKGENQINLAVTALNPLASSPTIDSSNFKVSVATPTVCALRAKTPITYSSGLASAFFIPLSIGTCTLKFDYLGNSTLKLNKSVSTWSVEITR